MSCPSPLEAIRFAVGRDRDDVVAGTTPHDVRARPVRQRVGVVPTVQNVVAGPPDSRSAHSRRTACPHQHFPRTCRPPSRRPPPPPTRRCQLRSPARRNAVRQIDRDPRGRTAQIEGVLPGAASNHVVVPVERDREHVDPVLPKVEVAAGPVRDQIVALAPSRRSSPSPPDTHPDRRRRAPDRSRHRHRFGRCRHRRRACRFRRAEQDVVALSPVDEVVAASPKGCRRRLHRRCGRCRSRRRRRPRPHRRRSRRRRAARMVSFPVSPDDVIVAGPPSTMSEPARASMMSAPPPPSIASAQRVPRMMSSPSEPVTALRSTTSKDRRLGDGEGAVRHLVGEGDRGRARHRRRASRPRHGSGPRTKPSGCAPTESLRRDPGRCGEGRSTRWREGRSPSCRPGARAPTRPARGCGVHPALRSRSASGPGGLRIIAAWIAGPGAGRASSAGRPRRVTGSVGVDDGALDRAATGVPASTAASSGGVPRRPTVRRPTACRTLGRASAAAMSAAPAFVGAPVVVQRPGHDRGRLEVVQVRVRVGLGELKVPL